MSLPLPRLDDRTFNALVEEAKQRIARRCPEWTDFNPSDPGMMLVELMAWMTETVLYRLNRVPELNYIKFLELVGLRLHPARPARTWVFFDVAEKAEESALQIIPADTQVSTKPQTRQEPVTFSTCAPLNLTTAKILKTCSRYRTETPGPVNQREEVHHLTRKTPSDTDIFQLPATGQTRGTAVPHHLYLGDSALGEFGTQTVLGVHVEVNNPEAGHLFLEWETWDGFDWQKLPSVEDLTEGFAKNGKIIFRGLPAMKPRPKDQLFVNPAAAGSAAPPPAGAPCWLRARLVGSSFENVSSLRIRKLERELGLETFALMPGRAFLATPPMQVAAAPHPPAVPSVTLPFQPIELTRDFYPFGTGAIGGSAFYLESSLFQRAGALIRIRFDIATSFPSESPVKVHWEYPTAEQSWELLGVWSRQGGGAPAYQFKDNTEGFTRTGQGTIEFRCPRDIAPIAAAGQSGFFIRARLESPGPAAAEIAVLAKSVALSFSNEIRPWPHCLTENYSQCSEAAEDSHFSPFFIDSDKDPAFYICFDKQPSSSRNPHALFLDVVPHRIDSGRPLPSAEKRFVKPLGAQLKWEYAGAGGWKALSIVKDGTEAFAHEGMVEFASAHDWQKTTEFNEAGFWLRVRWEIAEFLRPPRLRRVLLNSVEVEQRVPGKRIVGSSDGTANQTFSLNTGILEGPEVWVRESDTAPHEESPTPEQAPQPETSRDAIGHWLKWTEARNFYRSGPNDRHFTADLQSGTIVFGNGTRGKLPPAGRENVQVRYRQTCGRKGNVGANTITVLEQSWPNVQAVTNYYPAEGGSDRESIEEVKKRGPWEIKHRDRAVTEEDFVHLAQKASILVGPTQCYEENGIVHVVIVPNEPGEKPQPSRQLVQEVTAYLDKRRLINTRLKVLGPVYETIDLYIELVLDPRFLGQFNQIRLQADKCLRGFIHPIAGLNGSGWPLGRTLHLSELYYLLESRKVEGIDHVARLTMAKGGTDQYQDHISIGDRAYPYFGMVDIQQSFEP